MVYCACTVQYLQPLRLVLISELELILLAYDVYHLPCWLLPSPSLVHNRYVMSRLKSLCELYISKHVQRATKDSIAKTNVDIIGEVIRSFYMYQSCAQMIIMPRCACASEVYGSVFVWVCVDCYSCSRINEVQVRVSIGFYHVFLDSYSWICKIKLRSCLLGMPLQPFKKGP